jgi:hypothetical protein
MEISGRPIAGFGPGIAKRVPGSSAANSPRCSVFVSYGSSLRHFRVSHRDPVQSPVCSRDLRCGSLLRDIVDPALVASEATKITNAITGTRKSNCWCLVSPLCSKPLSNRVRGWSSQRVQRHGSNFNPDVFTESAKLTRLRLHSSDTLVPQLLYTLRDRVLKLFNALAGHRRNFI